MTSLAEIGVSPPFAPLAEAIVIDRAGAAMFPHPFDEGAAMKLPIGTGVTLDWAPIGPGAVVVALWAGTADHHHHSDEAIATAVTRSDLQQLILALMSIDQQMGGN